MSKEINPPTPWKHTDYFQDTFTFCNKYDSVTYHYQLVKRVRCVTTIRHLGIDKKVPCPISHRNRCKQNERSEAPGPEGMESDN